MTLGYSTPRTHVSVKVGPQGKPKVVDTPIGPLEEMRKRYEAICAAERAKAKRRDGDPLKMQHGNGSQHKGPKKTGKRIGRPKCSPKRDAALAYARTIDEFTSRGVAEHLGYSMMNMAGYISALRKMGMIEKVRMEKNAHSAFGIWHVTDKGRE